MLNTHIRTALHYPRQLYEAIANLLKGQKEYFSSMRSKTELGRIIELAAKESIYEAKGEKFLQLLREK